MAHVRHHQLNQRRLDERRLPGDERPGEAAEGVEIGPRPLVAPRPGELLGRHVARRAARRERLRRGLGVGLALRLRQAEVAEQVARRSVGPEVAEHVARLQVAVDHPARVRVRERAEHVAQQDAQAGPVARAATGVERAPVGELHGQKRAARGQHARGRRLDLLGHAAELVEPNDAGMVQPRHRLELVVERREHRSPHRLADHHLERHRQTARPMHAPPDASHATPAEQAEQLEGAERKARRDSVGRLCQDLVDPTDIRGGRRNVWPAERGGVVARRRRAPMT
jgi:hypothetical protein